MLTQTAPNKRSWPLQPSLLFGPHGPAERRERPSVGEPNGSHGSLHRVFLYVGSILLPVTVDNHG